MLFLRLWSLVPSGFPRVARLARQHVASKKILDASFPLSAIPEIVGLRLRSRPYSSLSSHAIGKGRQVVSGMLRATLRKLRFDVRHGQWSISPSDESPKGGVGAVPDNDLPPEVESR